MPVRSGYSSLQIALHWLIALLIVGAYLTEDNMGRALRSRIDNGVTGFEGNTVHVWLGGAALVLILIRLAVRLIQGAPPAPAGTPPMLERAALWGHRLLYVLMILAPALGAAAWYGHVRALGEPHEVMANALMLLALGHAVAAVYHQVVLKDGTLARMRRPG